VGALIAASLNIAAWAVIAGCGAAVLLLGLLTTGRWAAGTADRAAERLREPAPKSVVGAR
jgi:hypothetical protein